MCATLARLVPSFRTDSYSFRRHRSTVLNDHANKVSPSDDNDEVTTPDVHESYQYVGENSKIHFEMRTQRSLRDHRILQAVSFAVVLIIGGMLALIASMMVMVSAVLHQFREDAVDAVMRAGCDAQTASGRRRTW